MFYHNHLQYNPNMSAADAAKVWMRKNECTDMGLKAIICGPNKEMSVNYQETPHGIVIIAKDGTCLPVPYRYDGSVHNLLCNLEEDK